jgi:solute carrier family 13 (sodium-dependent dicarboxylate transporter), member 2/3/5
MISFPLKAQLLSKYLLILASPFLAFWGSLLIADPLQRWAGFIALWMMIWWVFEVVPLWITALLPITSPIFTSFSFFEIFKSYLHPVLLLFVGGFFLAAATEKSQLHEAIAQKLLGKIQSGKGVLISFIFLTAFLSMWISNSAACLLMIPLASLYSQHHNKNFHKALILGIAYASSIGGLATLIGSPPNALYLAHIQKLGGQVSFFGWMTNTLPFAIVGLLFIWVYLGKFCFSSVWKEIVRSEKSKQVSYNQTILFVFGIFIFGLLFLHLDWLPLTENLWIFFIGTSLFFLRSKGSALLEWSDTKNIPWNVLLIFAGGLALSFILEKSGLTHTLAQQMKWLNQFPVPITLFLLVVSFILITEIASNTAVAAIGLPLAAPLAETLALQPAQIAQAIVFSASLSFMLPVATPPNAIAFAQGKISGKQMAKIGWPINLFFSLWITLWILFFPL